MSLRERRLQTAIDNNILVYDYQSETNEPTTQLFRDMLRIMSENAFLLSNGVKLNHTPIYLHEVYINNKQNFNLKSMIYRVYAGPVHIYDSVKDITQQYLDMGGSLYMNKKNIVLIYAKNGILMLGCY